MKIYFDEEGQVSEEILETMNKAAETCLTLEEIDPALCEVSVSFVDGEKIHKLNREYRGVDRTTDVLSFPQFCDPGEIREQTEKFGLCEIGDVVICRDKAAEQAEEYGHSFAREIIYLFVHSILHLLGYDHMEAEEKKVMRAREEEVMDILGIPRRQEEEN